MNNLTKLKSDAREWLDNYAENGGYLKAAGLIREMLNELEADEKPVAMPDDSALIRELSDAGKYILFGLTPILETENSQISNARIRVLVAALQKAETRLREGV